MTVIQVYHHKFTGRGCGGRSRDYYFTSKPVADPAEGARASHLFLKQTEARGAKKKCFSNRLLLPPPPPLAEGLDPPLQSHHKLPVFFFHWAPRHRQRRAGFRYYIKWRFWSTINIIMNVFVFTCTK